jgi:hypothetical protein
VKAATNNQQWLVSISRGTRGLKVFTQSKELLRENICRSGNRELAIELAKPLRQSLATPQVIRRYVENLIQARRTALKHEREGTICKPKLDSKLTQSPRHRMRI